MAPELERSALISACTSRYAGTADPLIIETPSQTVLFMTDGSGSWGSGVEVAAWFRDWLAYAHKGADTVTATTIAKALQAGIEQLPSHIKNDDFGWWSFSIVAMIVDKTTIQIGACGAFAASTISPSQVVPLFAPARLIDQLVEQGVIRESEAESHKWSRIISGPFFGADNHIDLIWIHPIATTRQTQILIGESGLNRYLQAQPSPKWQTDPLVLREAVEKFSGRSAPTAILSMP